MQTAETAVQGRPLKNLQGLVVIDKSPRGRRLKQPIILEIPENLSPGERAVRRYVIEALCWKMPALIHLTLRNKTVLKLATHLYRHTTGSKATLYQYTYGVHRFFKWLGREPDDLIRECLENRSVSGVIEKMDEFMGDLKAEGLAPGTTSNHVKGVKALFRVNGIQLTLPYKVDRRVKYRDRAPTSKELEKIIDLADIREKAIISILALSGMRIGTLVKLEYRHVKKDLEAGLTPVHIHVEAEITKGKYHDYDTFIGAEAVEYLKAYLQARRNGTWYMPPEEIWDGSPLIRNQHSREVRPVSPACIHRLIHKLYAKAGLIELGNGKKRYRLRPHSIRKYFRTQLGSMGAMPTDYIEYMMGHTVSTYNDIRMKGIEFLRGKYAAAGLRIRQKEKADIYDFVEDLLRSKGYGIDKELLRKAIVKPHRTVCDPTNYEEERRIAIRDKFMEMLRKEFLEPSLEKEGSD
ncbi:MAG: tyrosine-type recombinase/integrase [Candidatus Bathyarchaeia archaeon]